MTQEKNKMSERADAPRDRLAAAILRYFEALDNCRELAFALPLADAILEAVKAQDRLAPLSFPLAAGEWDKLTSKRDAAREELEMWESTARIGAKHVEQLTDERDAMRAVVEAAREWHKPVARSPHGSYAPVTLRLFDAIAALDRLKTSESEVIPHEADVSASSRVQVTSTPPEGLGTDDKSEVKPSGAGGLNYQHDWAEVLTCRRCAATWDMGEPSRGSCEPSGAIAEGADAVERRAFDREIHRLMAALDNRNVALESLESRLRDAERAFSRMRTVLGLVDAVTTEQIAEYVADCHADMMRLHGEKMEQFERATLAERERHAALARVTLLESASHDVLAEAAIRAALGEATYSDEYVAKVLRAALIPTPEKASEK